MTQEKSTFSASLILGTVIFTTLFVASVISQSGVEFSGLYGKVVRALQGDEYSEYAKQRAQELEEGGKFAEAEEWYRESDSRINLLYGNNPELRIASLHYLYFNDNERAATILSNIVMSDLSSEDVLAYRQLAQELAFANEQFEDAIEHAQVVVQDSQNRFDQITAYEVQGLSLAALNREAEAREALGALAPMKELGDGNLPIHRVKAVCGSARIHAALGDVAEVRLLTENRPAFGEEPWYIFVEPELDCIYARTIAEAQAGNSGEAELYATMYIKVASEKLTELVSPRLAKERNDMETLIGE